MSDRETPTASQRGYDEIPSLGAIKATYSQFLLAEYDDIAIPDSYSASDSKWPRSADRSEMHTAQLFEVAVDDQPTLAIVYDDAEGRPVLNVYSLRGKLLASVTDRPDGRGFDWHH